MEVQVLSRALIFEKLPMLLSKSPTKDIAISQRILTAISFLIILWYVWLCFTNFLTFRPLWNDERAVFQSVEGLKGAEFFTKELINGQTFPHLYLFLIRQYALPFDFNLAALRLPSYICMLIGFFLWVKIASYEMKDKKQYATFLLSWCASVPLIYYSQELKQYSMDVMACALFVLFLYNQERLQQASNRVKLISSLILLPALLLFSYTAYFLVLFPLYNLIVPLRKDKKLVMPILLYIASFLICGLLSYFFDVRLRPVEINTTTYGSHFIYFDSIGHFFDSFGRGINDLFSRWFAERPRIVRKIGWFFVAFGLIHFFVGFFKNFKKQGYILKSIETIALVIFAESIILGALKKYPFSVPRTSLFFAPIILYMTVKGIVSVAKINVYLSRAIYALYVVFLAFIAVSLTRITYAGPITFQPYLW